MPWDSVQPCAKRASCRPAGPLTDQRHACQCECGETAVSQHLSNCMDNTLFEEAAISRIKWSSFMLLCVMSCVIRSALWK